MEGDALNGRGARPSNPPDFLVKLLAMIQDDADLIAWTGGKVFIQDPVALEKKLCSYFRHSNFSSFQRQLNNFGFRKVEGKGKFAPCMYMHEDLQGLPPDALLKIRRKTPTTPGPTPPGPAAPAVPNSRPAQPQLSTNGVATWPPARQTNGHAAAAAAASDAAKRRRTELGLTGTPNAIHGRAPPRNPAYPYDASPQQQLQQPSRRRIVVPSRGSEPADVEGALTGGGHNQIPSGLPHHSSSGGQRREQHRRLRASNGRGAEQRAEENGAREPRHSFEEVVSILRTTTTTTTTTTTGPPGSSRDSPNDVGGPERGRDDDCALPPAPRGVDDRDRRHHDAHGDGRRDLFDVEEDDLLFVDRASRHPSNGAVVPRNGHSAAPASSRARDGRSLARNGAFAHHEDPRGDGAAGALPPEPHHDDHHEHHHHDHHHHHHRGAGVRMSPELAAPEENRSSGEALRDDDDDDDDEHVPVDSTSPQQANGHANGHATHTNVRGHHGSSSRGANGFGHAHESESDALLSFLEAETAAGVLPPGHGRGVSPPPPLGHPVELPSLFDTCDQVAFDVPASPPSFPHRDLSDSSIHGLRANIFGKKHRLRQPPEVGPILLGGLNGAPHDALAPNAHDAPGSPLSLYRH